MDLSLCQCHYPTKFGESSLIPVEQVLENIVKFPIYLVMSRSGKVIQDPHPLAPRLNHF